MSAKPNANPFAAIREAGGSIRGRQADTAETPAADAGRRSSTKPAPSRAGTVPITGHFPRAVRDQLKILAIEQGKTVQSLQAEALNDLFAKYKKPEIAPTGRDQA